MVLIRELVIGVKVAMSGNIGVLQLLIWRVFERTHIVATVIIVVLHHLLALLDFDFSATLLGCLLP